MSRDGKTIDKGIRGTVKWYNDQRCYGFITHDIFVHRTAIVRPLMSLSEGQDVEFDIVQGPRGHQASNVIPVKSAGVAKNAEAGSGVINGEVGSPVSVSASKMATIPIRCVFPSFKDMLEHPSQLFQHDALPGISWELVFGPQSVSALLDADYLCIKAVMSKNKSQATVASASFSLDLENSRGDARPIEWRTSLRNFTKGAFSAVLPVSATDITKLIGRNVNIVLSGQITVALPSESPVLRQMYESSRFSDFAIKADNRIFNVHKAVLAQCQGFVDQISPGQTEFEVPASAEAVMAMLQHLYDDPLSFDGLEDLTCEVLQLAESFKLDMLKKICVRSLITAIKGSNVFKLAMIAEIVNSPILSKCTFDFAGRYIERLDFSDDWTKLKAAFLVNAVKSTAIAAPLEIPVRWEIPDFQGLMENSKCGFSIPCTEKFSHESMPGIAWELILYPNGKTGYSHHVALFMRTILTSDKKSQATAPFGGFSLRFEAVNQNVASAPPPEQNLPIQQFHLQSELGIAQFAHQPLVDEHCLDKKRSDTVVLTGKILVESASRQIIFNRKYLEGGLRADFSIKVDEDSFLVHKFILSAASPAMQAMFDMDCAESDAGFVVIKETTTEAVRALLQFWYGDPLCFDGLDELSMEVYNLANRYQDFELRQICEDALLRMISPDNVVYLAAFAADQNLESLAKAAAKVIIENVGVLKTQAWIQFTEDNFYLALSVLECSITKYRKTCGVVVLEKPVARRHHL